MSETAVPNLANLPEFSVSELSAALKRAVEDAFRLGAGAGRDFRA